MAIELLPLLEETGSPPIPGGEYVPPTASSYQEVADVTAEYLDFLNPDLRPSSLAKMLWDSAQAVWAWMTAPDGAFRSSIAGLEAGVDLIRGDVDGAIDAAENQFNFINGLLGNTAPGAPTITEQIADIPTAVGTAWWGTVKFDPTNPEWVLVGTDTFTDYIHFEEEGHVYIIDAIAPIVSRHEEIIDGEVVYFGLGWWAEMASDYRSQRSYLDFEKNLCHNRGHLMRGALVNFPKGGDGQISAYKYTPA